MYRMIYKNCGCVHTTYCRAFYEVYKLCEFHKKKKLLKSFKDDLKEATKKIDYFKKEIELLEKSKPIRTFGHWYYCCIFPLPDDAIDGRIYKQIPTG